MVGALMKAWGAAGDASYSIVGIVLDEGHPRLLRPSEGTVVHTANRRSSQTTALNRLLDGEGIVREFMSRSGLDGAIVERFGWR